MDSLDADRAAAWRLLFITMTHTLNSVEADLKASDDLTIIDIGCLFAITASGDAGVSMGALAALYAVDPSVITYRVKRLEARGAVSRVVNSDNRRYTQVVINDAGRRLLRRARGHMLTSADSHFFRHLQPTAVDTLQQVLQPLLTAQRLARSTTVDPTRR